MPVTMVPISAAVKRLAVSLASSFFMPPPATVLSVPVICRMPYKNNANSPPSPVTSAPISIVSVAGCAVAFETVNCQHSLVR